MRRHKPLAILPKPSQRQAAPVKERIVVDGKECTGQRQADGTYLLEDGSVLTPALVGLIVGRERKGGTDGKDHG